MPSSIFFIWNSHKFLWFLHFSINFSRRLTIVLNLLETLFSSFKFWWNKTSSTISVPPCFNKITSISNIFSYCAFGPSKKMMSKWFLYFSSQTILAKTTRQSPSIIFTLFVKLFDLKFFFACSIYSLLCSIVINSASLFSSITKPL